MTSNHESFLAASSSSADVKPDESQLWTDDLLDIHCTQSPEIMEAGVEDPKTVLYCCHGYSMEEHPYTRISPKSPHDLKSVIG